MGKTAEKKNRVLDIFYRGMKWRYCQRICDYVIVNGKDKLRKKNAYGLLRFFGGELDRS